MAKKVNLIPEGHLVGSTGLEISSPVKKGTRRYSNADFYEVLEVTRMDVIKEANLRQGEKHTDGLKHESAQQLQGLAIGLQAVIQRYKIFALTPKAF